MIKLTRLNGAELMVNDDLIESIERTPETILTMTDGKKFTIKDSAEEVIEKIVRFRRSIALPDIKD
ncbi:MAG: flagellar FlbD family protein [candidate division FCPU426 bacterium]